MTPPPGWPPSRSAEELREMAQRLQQALERESYPARRRKWLEAVKDKEAIKEAIIRELHEIVERMP
jgi:hypothetical protein